MEKLLIGIDAYDHTMILKNLHDRNIPYNALINNGVCSIAVGKMDKEINKLNLSAYITQVIQRKLMMMSLEKLGLEETEIDLLLLNEDNWWMSDEMVASLYTVVYLYVVALDILDIHAITENFFDDNKKELLKEAKTKEFII